MVEFTPNGTKKFSTKSKNLIKIVKLITDKNKKQDFQPKELTAIYKHVLANYTSEISKTDYKRITTAIKDFVEVGGSIEFK